VSAFVTAVTLGAREGIEPLVVGDEDLVRRFLDGDARAFDEIVGRHRDAVYRFCRWQLGGSRQEAEDATQDALVEAFRSLRRFAGRSRLRTWIFGLARNVCLRRRRAAARSLPASRDAGDEEALRAIPDAADDLEALLARHETTERVRREIEGLTPEHRVVVLLREIEGLSYEEIASAVGVPVGTVRSRLHNARAALALSLCALAHEGHERNAT
jgi:RNA polymerase sigma-70 factor, ECF subfamily